MGVKSTRHLTRKEAEDKYVVLRLETMDVERMLRSTAAGMNTEDLEDVLESLNDEVNGGEGFENYLITVGDL